MFSALVVRFIADQLQMQTNDETKSRAFDSMREFRRVAVIAAAVVPQLIRR
jgi:hypothetical protein